MTTKTTRVANHNDLQAAIQQTLAAFGVPARADAARPHDAPRSIDCEVFATTLTLIRPETEFLPASVWFGEDYELGGLDAIVQAFLRNIANGLEGSDVSEALAAGAADFRRVADNLDRLSDFHAEFKVRIAKDAAA